VHSVIGSRTMASDDFEGNNSPSFGWTSYRLICFERGRGTQPPFPMGICKVSSAGCNPVILALEAAAPFAILVFDCLLARWPERSYKTLRVLLAVKESVDSGDEEVRFL
jgi:hypothetical protein